MRRRRVLQSLSLAVAGIAGCTSGPYKSGPKWGPPETEPPVPSQDHSTVTPESTSPPTTAPGYGLETSFTYETATESDAFLVTVAVENTISGRRRAILVVTWTSGDQEEVSTRRVALDGGASTTFEFEFPGFGNLDFQFIAP